MRRAGFNRVSAVWLLYIVSISFLWYDEGIEASKIELTV
jgi:hypothetical protein